jgi:hypothetical protein
MYPEGPRTYAELGEDEVQAKEVQKSYGEARKGDGYHQV